jgi:hypothetical protein
MPQINCPSCQRALTLPDHMIGQQVRCPVCSHVFEASDKPAPRPAQTAPAGPPERPRDYDRPPERPRDHDRPPERPRDYDRPPPRYDRRDYQEPDYYDAPRTMPPTGGTAALLLCAGIVDVIAAVVLFIAMASDRAPGQAFLVVGMLTLVLYLAPVVFLFVAGGVVSNPRAKGLVITGAIMAFIIATELLIASGFLLIGIAVTMGSRFSRMPVWVPVLFLICVIGLVLTLIAGIKALLVVSRSPRRSVYD